MKRKRFILCFVWIASIVLLSCKKDQDSDLVYTNKQMYATMLYYYLWYEYLPDLDPSIYPSPQELLNELVYTPSDRWSFIMPATEFNQYFSGGEYIGHGFSSKWDENNNLRIVYVYFDSDLYPQGVRRGWKIKEINGTAITPGTYSNDLYGPDEEGQENSFVFENNEGQQREMTSTKKAIKVNTVLYHDIIDLGGKKVGHLVFESFIDPSEAELDSVFSGFASAGISHLILDLRYNGGGSTKVALHLASLIAGNMAEDEVLVQYMHNIKNQDKDKVQTISRLSNSVSIDNLVIIATQATASASELVINGLESFMNVVQIGDDTHGKPVGMYVFDLERMDLVLAPICFKLANSAGYGNYFGGLPADAYVEDDLTHDFGNPDESCLSAALVYLQTGNFGPTVKHTIRRTKLNKESITGQEILVDGSAW